MIKAVIFDWGGVVAPIRGGGWLEAFGHLTGLEGAELKTVWSYAYNGLGAGLIDLDVFWARVQEKTGKSYPDSKNSIWVDGLVGDPWQEIIAYSKELRSRGIATAVLSNTIKYMETLPWFSSAYDGFSPLILSHQVGLSKPDPRIYELILQQLGLNANECIFVDDMEKNLLPAKQMGIKTLLANNDPIYVMRGIEKLITTD